MSVHRPSASCTLGCLNSGVRTARSVHKKQRGSHARVQSHIACCKRIKSNRDVGGAQTPFEKHSNWSVFSPSENISPHKISTEQCRRPFNFIDWACGIDFDYGRQQLGGPFRCRPFRARHPSKFGNTSLKYEYKCCHIPRAYSGGEAKMSIVRT